MIDVSRLAEVIINILVRYLDLPKIIISDRNSLFLLKFWFPLYYFFKIKCRVSRAFYPQTNNQSKRKSSIIEAYLRTFVN